MNAFDLETCFHTCRARAYRWAYALCGRHEDALDATQEAFLRMAQNPPALPNAAAALAWLRRVTTRLVIDRRRAEQARHARERKYPRPAVFVPEASACDDQGTQLREALADLSEQQQLVLLCKCCDQMTFQQIADEFGIAVPTAKTHYLRALAAVRDRLKIDVEIGQ